MSFLARHQANTKLPDGRSVHLLGEPFQIQANGALWISAVFPDGKLRPVRAMQGAA